MVESSCNSARPAEEARQPLPDAGGAPAVEPLPGGAVLAGPFGQVRPGDAGPGDVRHGVHERTVVRGRAAGAARLAGRLAADRFLAVIGAYRKVGHKHLDAYLGELEWRHSDRENPRLFRDTIRCLLLTETLESEELIAVKAK